MVRGFQEMFIIGNLGRDPELRYTANGVAVCNAPVAVNGYYNDPNGERKENTEWFRLVAFDRQGENLATYATKGRQIMVKGRLQTRKYNDRNGIEQTAVEIVVNFWMLLGPRPTDEPEDDGEPPY